MKTRKNARTLLVASCAALWLLPAGAQQDSEVLEVEGVVERASGPADLLRLDGASKLTVRALRGFGLLPDEYAKLALGLRGQGVDLLAAGPDEVQALIARAEAGSLKTDVAALKALHALMVQRDFYQWAPLQPGAKIALGEADLLRGEGRAVLRDPAGSVVAVAPGGKSAPLAALAQPSAAPAAQTAPSPAVSASASAPAAPALATPAAPASAETAPVAQAPATAPMQAAPSEALPLGPAPQGGETEEAAAPTASTPAAPVALPRSWPAAPANRRFDLSMPDFSSAVEWQDLATLAAAADGGHVLAGSVQAPASLQAWVARYDAQGMPLWTRTLAGGVNLHVQSAGVFGDGGVLLAGSLGEYQPGFLVALDAKGAVRWSRVTDREWQQNISSEEIEAVAVSGTNALAVGQVALPSGERHGMAMLVPANGEPGWRVLIDDTTRIHAALADGDGWLVAGESHTPYQAAWLARLDAQGQVQWRHTYGQDNGGAARTLARLPGGELLIAGQAPESQQAWLRRADSSGAPIAEQTVDLRIQGSPVIGSLRGMSVTTDGDLLFAGETDSADGWLARLAPDATPRWVKVFGDEEEDAFNAVLARPDGVVAAGRSTHPERIRAHSLWTLRTDAAGEPITPKLSAPAQQALAVLGAGDAEVQPDVFQQADGSLRMLMPFRVLGDDLPLGEALLPETTLLAFSGRPQDKDGKQWRFTAELPDALALRDGQGNEVASLVADSKTLAFDVDTTVASVVGIDASLTGVKITAGAKPQLAGLYAGLGMTQLAVSQGEPADQEQDVAPQGEANAQGESESPQPEAQAPAFAGASLAKLALTLKLAPDAAGRWGGPLRFSASDWKLLGEDGKPRGQLAGADLSVDYHNVDLLALRKLSDEFESFMSMESEPDDPRATVTRLVESFLNASGEAKGSFRLTGANVKGPAPDEAFQLAELSVEGGAAASQASALLRDIDVRYGLKGLSLKGDGTTFELGSASAALKVDRLALSSIAQTVFGMMFGEPPAEGEFAATAAKLLGGLDLSLGMEGLAATPAGEPPIALARSEMKFALSALDTPAPALRLMFGHEGLKGMPGTPPELTPGDMKLDATLSNLPVAALIAGAMEGGDDPFMLLMQFAQAATQLKLDTLSFDMPIGGVKMSGLALTETPTAKDQAPRMRATADIAVRGLDALVKRYAADLGEAERKDLLASAALVKLAGIEEKQGDALIYRFAVVATSDGELTVNGKDLAPLLAAGGGEGGARQGAAGGGESAATPDAAAKAAPKAKPAQ